MTTAPEPMTDCPRCDGQGGEQLSDGWMPCYCCCTTGRMPVSFVEEDRAEQAKWREREIAQRKYEDDWDDYGDPGEFTAFEIEQQEIQAARDAADHTPEEPF
jgi:hypothetical protein